MSNQRRGSAPEAQGSESDSEWYGRELNRHADRANRALEQLDELAGLLKLLELLELLALGDWQCQECSSFYVARGGR